MLYNTLHTPRFQVMLHTSSKGCILQKVYVIEHIPTFEMMMTIFRNTVKVFNCLSTASFL